MAKKNFGLASQNSQMFYCGCLAVQGRTTNEMSARDEPNVWLGVVGSGFASNISV